MREDFCLASLYDVEALTGVVGMKVLIVETDCCYGSVKDCHQYDFYLRQECSKKMLWFYCLLSEEEIDEATIAEVVELHMDVEKYFVD